MSLLLSFLGLHIKYTILAPIGRRALLQTWAGAVRKWVCGGQLVRGRPKAAWGPGARTPVDEPWEVVGGVGLSEGEDINLAEDCQ